MLKIILKQYEPLQLFKEINVVSSKWLSKSDDGNDITLLHLLSFIIPYSSASRRIHIEALLKKQFLIDNSFPQLCIGPLYNIIRNLKTSDKQICDAYWSNILYWLKTGKPHNQKYHRLLRVCNR